MEMIATPESSNLTSFGYDEGSSILRVEFHNGGVYDYFDVPNGVFEQMKAAPSKGQFLAQNIKPYFRYARV